MSDSITPRSAAFFADHAGYDVQPGETIGEARARVGGSLARAHALLADAVDAGAAIVHWDFDQCPDPDDDAGTREAWEAGEIEPYCCAIEIDGDFAAALGGIWLSTSGAGKDPYCDVIEAELALEAETELRDALAAHLEKELRAAD
jgi:hypothetical protein